MPDIQAQFNGTQYDASECFAIAAMENHGTIAYEKGMLCVRASFMALNRLSRIRLEFSKAQKKETEK